MTLYRADIDQGHGHVCDSYCQAYCEVCNLDYCDYDGHECLLDEFNEEDEEAEGLDVSAE